MEAPGAGVQSLNVQPFPLTGVPYQVARAGIHATWTRDGKELLYSPAAAGQGLGQRDGAAIVHVR
jgi:hypothetical protein